MTTIEGLLLLGVLPGILMATIQVTRWFQSRCVRVAVLGVGCLLFLLAVPWVSIGITRPEDPRVARPEGWP